MFEACLDIPMLLWIALDMGFVLIAAVLVAYGEVNNHLFLLSQSAGNIVNYQYIRFAYPTKFWL